MSFKVCRLFAPEWWEVPGQDSDTPLRFFIKGLLGIDHFEASQNCEEGPDGAVVLTAKTCKIAISRGVLDVENTENLVGYDSGKSLWSQLPSNPVNVVGMLAWKVMQISTLQEPEKKDCASASRSGETLPDSTATSAAGGGTATTTDPDPEAEAPQDTPNGESTA